MVARYEHSVLVVGIPVYNEENFVAETLQSLQRQSYPDFVAVISDNASSDRTAEICERMAAEDSRFHLVRQKRNLGSAENCNYLLRITESPFFMWLGAHDLLHPDFLAHHLAALSTNPSATLSYSNTQWIDDRGAPVRVTPASNLATMPGTGWRRYIASFSRIGECTAVNQLLRRSALRGFSFAKLTGADHVLLSRLLLLGEVCFSETPLYYRRSFEDRDPRSADYMERITGSKGQVQDRRQLIEGYARDFWQLPRPMLEKLVQWPAVAVGLRSSFGGRQWRRVGNALVRARSALSKRTKAIQGRGS